MKKVSKGKGITVVSLALVLVVVSLSGCITPVETYQLTITTTPGGTTNPSPGTYTYTKGSAVSVTAIPVLPLYDFDHWVLDGVNVGSTNPITVAMDSDHTLHAVFVYTPPPETTWRVRMRYKVRDDSDPWIKGDGEWYFKIVATTDPPFTGRAPSSGTWKAVEGTTYDKTLATMKTKTTTFSVKIDVWEDDDISDDHLGERTFQVTGSSGSWSWDTKYFYSTVYITKI